MYSIRKSDFIRFSGTNNTVSVIRAEMFCDTAADLPAYNAVSGTELYMGSIAYDIATGDMYVMNSSHEWKNSNGSASSAKSMSMSMSGEGKGVEDDELIRDPEGE